jgi:glucose-1-phosphate thymidylyltransferase
MIYYPLTVLMIAGITEILIITTPQDKEQFQRALGDGSQWGISLEYITQATPDGLAQAFILGEKFLSGRPSVLILGDNIFFGHGLPELLKDADQISEGATVFAYRVSDPERYGVVDYNADGTVNSIIEKPLTPPSNYAVTGLYFVDGTAPGRAKKLKSSARGELEISSLLESYLRDDALSVKRMGRGYSWFDTGTHSSLLDAGNFVRTVTERQGQQVGSPDEVAFETGLISSDRLNARAKQFGKNNYGKYLKDIANKT